MLYGVVDDQISLRGCGWFLQVQEAGGGQSSRIIELGDNYIDVILINGGAVWCGASAAPATAKNQSW